MIKHLLTTLCALALVTTGSIPALAAEADTGELSLIHISEPTRH